MIGPLPPAAYPLAGMLYTITNFKEIAEPVGKSLSIALGISLSTIIPLILLTLKTQSRLVTRFLRRLNTGLSSASVLGVRLSTWMALVLCMGEASLLVYMIMGSRLEGTREHLFDEVLHKTRVPIGPFIDSGLPIAELTHSTDPTLRQQRRDFSALAQLAVSGPRKADLLLDPARAALGYLLEFIPVIGPLAFAYLEGERTAIKAHKHYFVLKNMTKDQRGKWLLSRKNEYDQFGFVAAALEAVPLVGSFAKFSNSVGAALWAAELEREQQNARNGMD
ncbi:hypothetical protein BC832DRAFT_559521 [Gaertneriomyces semiglobifer]|nr:hypothetical protein BC832DRAFT_559521 [Gaertneriomyces semiglobifer]